MPKSQTTALARQADAVERFRSGETFQQIAEGVGFSHRGSAHRAVTKAFRERIVEDIDTHRDQELERIDFVEVELLKIAAGSESEVTKIRALSEILAAGRQRAKLLGLYDHAPETGPRSLFDPRVAQLREGNICRMTGIPQCGFEPAFHSPECANQSWAMARTAAEEASNDSVAGLPAPSDGEDLLK